MYLGTNDPFEVVVQRERALELSRNEDTGSASHRRE